MMGSIAIAASGSHGPRARYFPAVDNEEVVHNQKERLIRMRPPVLISKSEKIMFPDNRSSAHCFLVPSGLPLLGMLFLGNLLKESGVTKRLATTASGTAHRYRDDTHRIDRGCLTQATTFLTEKSLVFAIGAASFIIATFGGVLVVKFLNLFLKEGNKINLLIVAMPAFRQSNT